MKDFLLFIEKEFSLFLQGMESVFNNRNTHLQKTELGFKTIFKSQLLSF